ncbi:MAG: Sua5/YciO/YrdC/YwlC family protein, partial [Myxococcales bacterium]|nr:Sua5/YciO/YrdC/YwlC family protein [Myxococcales bacterium]
MPSRADARAAAGAADEGEIARAAERIAAGGLVAFPTETVWGLAADAASASALAALARFKGRPLAQATSVLVSGPERLAALALDVDARARAWIDAFWPGPLTLVLPSRAPDALAPGIANARGEVGVRC